jgi:uncharacterized protein (DUF1778 family)
MPGETTDAARRASKLLLRKVRDTFPNRDLQEILAILDQFGVHHERVCLAALKASEGDIERLRRNIEDAKMDWRDIIAAAEYPGEWRLGWRQRKRLTEEDRKRLAEQDRQEYLDWLNSPVPDPHPQR